MSAGRIGSLHVEIEGNADPLLRSIARVESSAKGMSAAFQQASRASTITLNTRQAETGLKAIQSQAKLTTATVRTAFAELNKSTSINIKSQFGEKVVADIQKARTAMREYGQASVTAGQQQAQGLKAGLAALDQTQAKIKQEIQLQRQAAQEQLRLQQQTADRERAANIARTQVLRAGLAEREKQRRLDAMSSEERLRFNVQEMASTRLLNQEHVRGSMEHLSGIQHEIQAQKQLTSEIQRQIQAVEAARRAAAQSAASAKVNPSVRNIDQSLADAATYNKSKDALAALQIQYAKTQGAGDAMARAAGNISTAFNEADAAAESLGDELNETAAGAQSIDAMAYKLRLLGAGLTASVTLPIIGIGKAILQTGSEFESAWASVTKVAEGTPQQLEELRQGILDLSQEIPATASAIAEIAALGGALGIPTEQLLAFTDVAVRMGVSTNLAADQAADAMARFANITGIPQTAANFEALGATVVDLGNKTAATEKEILFMALRLAAAGTQIGLTEADILGISATLASLGVRAEAGGSAFSKLMLVMQNAVSGGGFALEQFAEISGQTAEGFAEVWETRPADAIGLFLNGLNQMKEGGENVFPVLKELELNDIRVRDATLRAANAQQLFADNTDIASAALLEHNALQRESAIRFETTASKWQILKNQASLIAIELFDELQPAIVQAMNAMSAGLVVVEALAHVFEALPTPIQAVVIALLGITAALGPALVLIGLMVPGWVALTAGAAAATFAFGTATLAVEAFTFSLLASPLGLFVLALIGLSLAIFGVIKYWDELVGAVSASWDPAIAGVKEVLHWLDQIAYYTTHPLEIIIELIKVDKDNLWDYITGEKGILGAGAAVEGALEASPFMQKGQKTDWAGNITGGYTGPPGPDMSRTEASMDAAATSTDRYNRVIAETEDHIAHLSQLFGLMEDDGISAFSGIATAVGDHLFDVFDAVDLYIEGQKVSYKELRETAEKELSSIATDLANVEFGDTEEKFDLEERFAAVNALIDEIDKRKFDFALDDEGQIQKSISDLIQLRAIYLDLGETGVDSLGSLSNAVSEGTLTADQAISLLSSSGKVSFDALKDAATSALGDVRAQLADARLAKAPDYDLIGNLEGQEDFLEGLLQGGINKFKELGTASLTAGEQIISSYTNIGAQAEDASTRMGLWEQKQTDANTALDLNQQLFDKGRINQEQYLANQDKLTAAAERYGAGILDESYAFIDAQLRQADYTAGLDALNEKYPESMRNSQAYKDAVVELSRQYDPALGGQVQFTNAIGEGAAMMDQAITKLALIYNALGLLSDEEFTLIIGVDPTNAQQELDNLHNQEPIRISVEIDAKVDTINNAMDTALQSVFGTIFGSAPQTDGTTIQIGADVTDAEHNLGELSGQVDDFMLGSPYTANVLAETNSAEAGLTRVLNGALGLRSISPITLDVVVNTGAAEAAIASVAAMTRAQSPPKEGPLSYGWPDWSYLFEGMQGEVDEHAVPAIDTLARHLPMHSPAEEGPLRNTPNWDYLFEGLAASADKYSEDALNHIKAFVEVAQAAVNLFDATIDLGSKINIGVTLPDPAVLDGIKRTTELAVQAIVDSAQLFRKGGLEKAKVYSDAANAIYGFMSTGLDVFAKLATYETPDPEDIASFKFATEHLVLSIKDSALYAVDEGLPEAKVYAETFGAIFDAMSAGLDVFAKFADFERPSNSDLSEFKFATEHLVLSIKDSALYGVDEGLPEAQKYAETFGAIFDAMQTGMDVFAAFADFDRPDDADISDFKFATEHLVLSIKDSALYGVDEGLPEAENYARVMGSIFDAMLSGFEVFDLLNDFERPPNARISAFKFATEFLVDEIADAALAAGDGVDEAENYAQTMDAIFTALSNGVDALNKLSDPGLTQVPKAALDRFLLTSAYIIRRITDESEMWRDDSTGALATARDWAETVGAFVDLIGKGSEGLNDLADFSAPMQADINAYFDAVDLVMDAAIKRVGDWKTKSGTIARDWADTAGSFISLIAEGVETLENLSRFNPGPKMIQSVDRLLAFSKKYVDRLIELTRFMDDEGLATASNFLGVATDIFGLIAAATDIGKPPKLDDSWMAQFDRFLVSMHTIVDKLVEFADEVDNLDEAVAAVEKLQKILDLITQATDTASSGGSGGGGGGASGGGGTRPPHGRAPYTGGLESSSPFPGHWVGTPIPQNPHHGYRGAGSIRSFGGGDRLQTSVNIDGNITNVEVNVSVPLDGEELAKNASTRIVRTVPQSMGGV